jgi:hypothetical protein
MTAEDLPTRLSALLVRTGSLKQEQRFAEASQLIVDACLDLFGFDRRFLQMMQPAHVAALLVKPGQVTAFAQLFAEEADLLDRERDWQSAAATAGWILGILAAARAPEDTDLLRRLRALQVTPPQ